MKEEGNLASFGCPEADKCVISHVYCHVEEEGFFRNAARINFSSLNSTPARRLTI